MFSNMNVKIQLRVKQTPRFRALFTIATLVSPCNSQHTQFDFAKLLAGSDQHDLSFVLIKFQFVNLHPRPYGANTLFHRM